MLKNYDSVLKGIFVISLLVFEVKEFFNYWNSIFLNRILFLDEYVINFWLLNVFCKYIFCDLF